MDLYFYLSMKKAPAFAGAVVDDIGIEVREWCVFACRQVFFCAITDENCENRC